MLGQVIPNGLLVTEPIPDPVTETFNAKTGLKIAVTVCAEFIVTTQVLMPAQAAELHPANADPVSATAVKVTMDALSNPAEHVPPHVIPAGRLVTVPVPDPLSVTVSENCGGGANVAMTCTELVPIVMLHGAVPEHAPVHPANVELPDGVAVSVTVAPVLKLVEHVEPQLIPAGRLDTDPVPVPASVTVTG